jgi:hypothetical protein
MNDLQARTQTKRERDIDVKKRSRLLGCSCTNGPAAPAWEHSPGTSATERKVVPESEQPSTAHASRAQLNGSRFELAGDCPRIADLNGDLISEEQAVKNG